MPDHEIEHPEAAAQDQTPPGAPEETQAPAQPADTEDSSPAVTLSQKKLDAMFGKVREDERRKTRELEERVQRMEAERAQQPQQPAQPPITVETVLAAYEHGQITETQKDQWLLHLNEERAVARARTEMAQAISGVVVGQQAQSTIERYARAYPAINDTGSSEFQEVKAAFLELLSEGLPNTVATQAKAVRIALGPLRGATTNAREHTRSRADTFLEGSGGGGAREDRDPVKDVPERIQAHWKKMGYTKAQMAQEAKLRDVRSIDDYRRLAVKR